jgi:DNA-binding beta-propeller fold protein YncE
MAGHPTTTNATGKWSLRQVAKYKSDGLWPVDLYKYSDGAWDLSTQSYVQNFSVLSQEAAPTGVYFKPDGTKMYVTGSSGDDINEYNLSTAWDVSTASYSRNFSVSSQSLVPRAVHFKYDGTKMYVADQTTNKVFQYSLSTAWDVSTASYDSSSVALTANSVTLWDVFINPNNGTDMYVVELTNDNIDQYTLSTPWDVSTATYVQNYLTTDVESQRPYGIFFDKNGRHLFMTTTDDWVYQFYLETPWDITTAKWTSKKYEHPSEAQLTGIYVREDGLKMYLIGYGTDAVWEYNLGN